VTRLLPAIVVLTAAVELCLGSPVGAAAAVTDTRSISPLQATGHLAAGYTVKHQYADANCVSGSPTTGTAYECFSSRSPEGVFDSCWVQANPGYATCLANPWTHNAIRLRVTGGYDNRGGFTHVATPWGLRLGAKTRCLVDLGGVRTADGHAVTYRCTNNIILVGSVHRATSPWRISAYRRVRHPHGPTTYTPLGRKPVSVSWKGQRSRAG
jgi:hypothetical protein